jgi:serine phosphatase RsbU (regulator of sigma subunit)
MQATTARTTLADTIGADTIACIVPQVDLPIEQQIEALQGKITSLSFELSALRRRDAHVHGVISRLDEEQRLAARLQQDFLPKKLPRVGAIHFHTLFRPAGYVSGDLYDVMRLDESNVGFYVADAVGHGMPAALLTMFMKNALVTKDIKTGDIKAGTYELLEPSQTISRLNNSLCQQDLSHATFATAIYGRIDTNALRMRFSTGGHPNPVMLRDGLLCELPNSGALLGIFPDEPFANAEVQLQTGDRVFIYTDGIEVAFAESGVDSERWKTELLNRADWPTDRILSDISARLDESNGSILPKDDLTIVAIEVK